MKNPPTPLAGLATARVLFVLFLLAMLPGLPRALADGVQIRYQLPTDGPLPRTYLVTLAAADAKDPDWVISNFAAGVARTVTAENKGQFTETWDGLDDNFMPVPAGSYVIKGIYAPAEKWGIDGQYHALTAKLAAAGNSWFQTPAEDTLPGKIEGDSVNAPFRAINTTPDGKGVLLFAYLENAENNYQIDLTKPIGYGQIGSGFGSGSAAGGSSVCTDGDTIWSYAAEGGVAFIYRPDGKAFGTQRSAGRRNVTVPDGRVTAMAAWKSDSGTVVFAAERGKMIQTGPKRWVEGETEFTNEVEALNGTTGKLLAEWKMEQPLGLAVRNGKLYALHRVGAQTEVDALALDANFSQGQFAPVFTVPANIHPFDVAVDGKGRFYLSDPDANHAYQLDARGQVTCTYGHLDSQKDASYDPLTLMSPQKLASWTDAQGKDRLLIVEQGGPNRMSEWDDAGGLIREWVTPQLTANAGYGVDPRHPNLIYQSGQMESMVRWKVDYQTGQWKTDAVWQNTGPGPFRDKFSRHDATCWAHPKVVYHGDDLYLLMAHGSDPFVLRLEGDHFRACTGILNTRDATGKTWTSYLWRDTNGDGKLQDSEMTVIPNMPKGVILPRTFGDAWADDFSLLCIGMGTSDVWRLPSSGFDAKGNPIYDVNGWQKLLTDDIFAAKQAGTETALRGGNEVGKSFSSDWSSVTTGTDGGYYVLARSGPNLTANFGTQFKLSRYVPDGKGGFVQKWRVGRIAIEHNAPPGEVYGPIFISPPVNGLIGFIDNSRGGAVIYREDGLYVDTLLPDARVVAHDQRGAYWLPGEFFAGIIYPNKDDGKVYLGVGKTFPTIYNISGWTTAGSAVHPLDIVDKMVSLTTSQIAQPPEFALQVRGGASASKVGFFYPAPGGGPKIDGSMDGGWDACDPIKYTTGGGIDQGVEVRCLYDPDTLYLRWHARLGHPFQARTLRPAEHLFAHDRQADTLGLYLQGDPNAPAGSKQVSGRPGDVRLVFGLFTDEGVLKPVVLGMYPTWNGPGGTPITYNTAQTTSFANVGLVPNVRAGYTMDPDGKGFVLATAIPRSALPGNAEPDGLKTTGNFDANFGGVNRFWWSNADGSANRDTFDEPTEARLFPGSWEPFQFLPMQDLPIRSWMAIGPFGDAQLATLKPGDDATKIVNLLWKGTYPPDTARDFGAVYNGDLTQTAKARRTLRWTPESLAEKVVAFKTALKWDGYQDSGTVYLCTHIYSPAPATVGIKTNDPHGKIGFHAWLNGTELPQDPAKADRIAPDAPLALQAGWNELLIRYDYFYGKNEFGASLTADPAVLWKLRVSGPEQKQ